jgi:hypothetical protein
MKSVLPNAGKMERILQIELSEMVSLHFAPQIEVLYEAM